MELQKIYDSEIDIRISWLWDAGIDVWLGDDVNGYVAQENVRSLAEMLPWFQEAITHFYPASDYAKSLAEDVVERARNRIFMPPQVGAQVRCPHCDAPHAAAAGITQLLGFTCSHCGAAVRVEVKIQ